MTQVFTCACGTKTTAPFYVHGRLLCTLCTEESYPHLVNQRARDEWSRLSHIERRNVYRAERQRRMAFYGER